MDESISTLGPLMKAARKFKKYNQADVAQAIGCSQSALSKMEHNLLTPSAPQWFLFSRFTSIPPETLESGVIDRHSKVKFNNDQVSLGFKIPKKYRPYRAEKVRELYPFLTYLEKTRGHAKVNDYISFTGLDPEFFLDFDNLINFQLLMDTMDYFVKLGKDNPNEIHEIVKLGQNDLYWDHFGVEWGKLSSITEVLNAYVTGQIFFQTDFQLKVETFSGKITISYFPEYHLKNLSQNVSPETIAFLNHYREATLENLILKTLNQKITVTLSSEVHTSPLGARFEIKEAA